MVLLSTAYLGPVSYYRCLYNQGAVIERYCNYQKQSYRNRCRIATEAGVMTLSIPVEKPATVKAPTRDILISRHDNWEHLHWTAITSAYNSSPYFEYYCDDFRPFYERPAKYKYLFDFNEALCKTVCRLMNISPCITFSNEYITPTDSNTDFREAIHPKRPAVDAGKLIPYYQVFAPRNGFIPDLSVIDLLFNLGPESVFLLQEEPVAI